LEKHNRMGNMFRCRKLQCTRSHQSFYDCNFSNKIETVSFICNSLLF